VAQLAHWMCDILDAHTDEAVIERVAKQVHTICQQFPVYPA
jgi:glycine hydroxymethyltransferase